MCIRDRILTADAWGDNTSGTISIYDSETRQIKRVKEYDHRQFQLARIYRYTTLLLRMIPNEHEYKVMGLAPYYNGKMTQEVEKVYDKMLKINGLEFEFNSEIKDIYHYLQENLSEFRFDHIASGVQSFSEKILVEWFTNALKEYNSDSIVFSGSSSTILMTFTNLFNCFFTCSTDSSSVTIVIFDLPSTFVGPTASEFMLKPLLDIVDATLAKTPGLSSTNILNILSLIIFLSHPHLKVLHRCYLPPEPLGIPYHQDRLHNQLRQVCPQF